MTLMTFEQIVEDVIEWMHPSLKQTIVETPKDDLIKYHHSWGRSIRNDYQLWNPENPLTMKDYQPQLENGVDVNPRHPDQVSMLIIEQVWDRLRHLHLKNKLYPDGVPTTLEKVEDQPKIHELYQRAKTTTVFSESSSLHCWSEVYIIDDIKYQFIGLIGHDTPDSVDIFPKRE